MTENEEVALSFKNVGTAGKFDSPPGPPPRERVVHLPHPGKVQVLLPQGCLWPDGPDGLYYSGAPYQVL